MHLTCSYKCINTDLIFKIFFKKLLKSYVKCKIKTAIRCQQVTDNEWVIATEPNHLNDWFIQEQNSYCSEQGRSHGCARVCRCHPQWQLAHLKTDAEFFFFLMVINMGSAKEGLADASAPPRKTKAPPSGAELWAGLDGPVPAHIDSWPAQSEIKK